MPLPAQGRSATRRCLDAAALLTLEGDARAASPLKDTARALSADRVILTKDDAAVGRIGVELSEAEGRLRGPITLPTADRAIASNAARIP